MQWGHFRSMLAVYSTIMAACMTLGTLTVCEIKTVFHKENGCCFRHRCKPQAMLTLLVDQ